MAGIYPRQSLAATGIQLTTAWGINAGYEHFWSPQWRTSLYGGYAQTSYNSTANALICASLGAATVVGWRGSGKCGLQPGLEPVVDRLPDSMERDEGLLHGS